MNDIDLFKMDIYQDDKIIISHNRFGKMVKRALDILFSIVALVITSPIIMLSCIAIRLESKGAPIYKQERAGFAGKSFIAYKLRTMYDHSSDGNLSAPKAGDNRVTKVGRFLRKTSIDELPQFMNVLKGDMSILGPRAVPAKELELRINAMMENDNTKECFYRRAMKVRSLVRPGISGLAQANGRSDLSVEIATAYDVFYVINYSLLLDVDILIKTIKIVLFRKGVN